MFLFLHILRDKSLFQSTPKCTGKTSGSLAWMQKCCFPLYNALCLTSPDICHILFPPFPHICWVVFSAMFTLFLQVGRVSKCLCWPSAIILTCAESIPVTITTPWEVCIFSEQNMCLEKIRQHLNRDAASLCASLKRSFQYYVSQERACGFPFLKCFSLCLSVYFTIRMLSPRLLPSLGFCSLMWWQRSVADEIKHALL